MTVNWEVIWVFWSHKFSKICKFLFCVDVFAIKTWIWGETYRINVCKIYVTSRSLRSASEQRITVPSQRSTKSLSLTFSLTVPIWWNDLELNPSSWILTHLQETAKNITLTLASSILIIFDLSVFFLFKRKTHTHLILYQLYIYSLTASFS